MSRWIGPDRDHIDDVLAAADAWRDRCFLTDGSLFGDENLWTLDNIRELRRRVFDEPIEGEGSFVEKIEKQLKTASPQLIRLAAETVWLLHLFPASSSMKQETKRNQVKKVWERSGSDLTNSSYLGDETLKGVAHPGQQYFQNRGQNFEFLIQAMERWKTEPQSRQAALMNEDAPWSLARWFDEIEKSDRRPMRSVILYLLFPDYMERISSLQDRRRIVETLKSKIPSEFRLNNEFSSVDIDRALYELRKDLEKEHGTIDFYTSPIEELWRPDSTPKQDWRPDPTPDRDYGLEPDQTDPSETKIEHPFDPEKIKVRPVNILVEQLISRIRHGEIDLAPDFQRLQGIWPPIDQSRLVESLLLRIPLPVFYVASDEKDNWAVVDGLQRMSTINRYVSGEFNLSNLEYLTHLEGKKHGDLGRPMQRRISETSLVVNVIEWGTPDEVMFNIFHRINTGGTKLNGQEIRHALVPGPVRSYLKTLSELEEFLEATGRSIAKKRMADRDCVLRFLAFHIDDWEKYAANDIDGYLTNAMKRINKMTEQERNSITDDFKRAMQAAADIFGEDAFRKLNPNEPRRYPINKALFGAWAVGLARRSQEDISHLVQERKRVQERFMTLLQDDQEFEKAISYSTGTPARVRKQFRTIDDLIEECL